MAGGRKDRGHCVNSQDVAGGRGDGGLYDGRIV